MNIREIREISGLIIYYTRMICFFLNTPTRYESVGCDDENFSSLKEYEFTRLHESHEFARAALVLAVRDVENSEFTIEH